MRVIARSWYDTAVLTISVLSLHLDLGWGRNMQAQCKIDPPEQCSRVEGVHEAHTPGIKSDHPMKYQTTGYAACWSTTESWCQSASSRSDLCAHPP